MVELNETRLRACRAAIALACRHGSRESVPAVLGTITLRATQCEAVSRAHTLLDEYRGCLLADDVGRGKTFVALAVARRWTRPLVVLPAALRDTWRLAMQRAGVDYPLITHESLSRGRTPEFEPDGIIVDESHHFRNSATRRYDMLADVAIRAELVLLSATPVQNAIADLTAQLALFLGSAVNQLDVSRLASFVVRVVSSDAADGLPIVTAPRWVPVRVDDSAVLRAILSLPAPPCALDAGDAGALRTIALVRAWSSSRAALLATIARRRRSVLAIEQSVAIGRVPTRAEVRSWSGADDAAFQLGFAELLVTHELSSVAQLTQAELRAAIDAEHLALSRLVALLRTRDDVDTSRADALLDIVGRHKDERVLAFTERASTARAYHALLRAQPGVGLLTARGALIASGRVTRRELLARFAPSAQGCAEPPVRERVSLLITTDLLSEGVNLQDASVVVHLDLPWNPARMAQRVGRVRRPHGAATVSSYLLAPPADAEELLAVETRLRRKLDDAEQSIGRSLPVVPTLTLSGIVPIPPDTFGAAERRGVVYARLRTWGSNVSPAHARRPMVVGATSSRHGWLACLADGRLLAEIDGVVGDDMELLDSATHAAEGDVRPHHDAELQHARRAMQEFVRGRQMLADCGVRDLSSPIARALLRSAAQRIHAAPRHDRPQCHALLARLRVSLRRPCSLGAERAFMSLLVEDKSVRPGDWLAKAQQVLSAESHRRSAESHPSSAPHVIILFGQSASVASEASSGAERF